MIDVKQRLEELEQRIELACQKANRSRSEISLVAVTKTVSVELMKQSVDLGVRYLGENKPQEIVAKYPDFIEAEIEWHQIGHLQTNKVKKIIDKVVLIQSLDRQSLADEIEKRAKQINKQIRVLIQINIGAEVQKSGVAVSEVRPFVQYIADNCPHIKVEGLMCIAPNIKEQSILREYFRKMKEIFEDLSNYPSDNIRMKILSMGMSSDFEIAIAEGATMLRIGSAIYGERLY